MPSLKNLYEAISSWDVLVRSSCPGSWLLRVRAYERNSPVIYFYMNSYGFSQRERMVFKRRKVSLLKRKVREYIEEVPALVMMIVFVAAIWALVLVIK